MGKKYYAVRNGKVPGIFETWDECKDSVHGYPGAEYKSFAALADAESYLGGGPAPSGPKRERAALPKAPQERRSDGDELIAYVDGSYNAATGEFSYGAVFLLPDEELCLSEKMADPLLAQMHNVAGEIKGSEAAMRYALENGYRRLVVYHDYEGIAKWCLGQWKTNKEGTKAYKAFYDGIKDRLEVKFVKVTGHSNDKYNDMADALAKEALGI